MVETTYRKIDNETLEVTRTNKLSKEILLLRKDKLEKELLSINTQLDILG